MATTAAGTPYVESSDLVANYPGVSLALANHIDTLGKVLQVVRATDATDRLTTSTSFVDASISVTITPQRSTSAILIIWTSNPYIDNLYGILRITDSSNNAIPGAQVCAFGPAQVQIISTMIGYDLPGSISAKTYKGRFRVSGTAILTIQNSAATGQLFAIEVAA